MFGYAIIQKMYNGILRPYLPTKYRLLAGVAVHDTPLLDFNADKKFYKQGLMRAIKDGVDEGDDVVLVGFGRGVSTVQAFDSGASHVTAYEAASEMIELAKETVKVNRPFDKDLTIQQAIVGDAKEIYGDASKASIENPSNLCEGDVLVLDCEGSEKSILEGLGTYPKTIICETHPERGVPTRDTLDVLQSRYSIRLFDYEPEGEDDKKVILAKSK